LELFLTNDTRRQLSFSKVGWFFAARIP
jgi:hypothetical protein